MKAAIYSRKSRFTEKGESIENQITLCQEYGNNIGITDFIIYEDEGFSGGNTERPQFKNMMKDAKAKKFEILICYRLDRISRNVSDFTSTIEELKRYDINFISIREQFDTTSPMGRAMMNIAAVFAQLERETIAERIKDNMMELAKTGRWLGGTTPIGYCSEPVIHTDAYGKGKKMFKLSLIEEEAQLVKLIYKIFMEKKNFSSTANYLCSHSYVGKNGGEFSRETVKQIITNPVYCISDEKIFDHFKSLGATIFGSPKENKGLMVYNKREGGQRDNPIGKWIISVGDHPGIIDSTTFVKCARIYKENTEKKYPKTSTGTKFLLSGLVICGKCGSSMASWAHNNPRTRFLERYYRCSLKQRASNRCSCSMLNAYDAEQYVIDFITQIDKKSIIKDLIKLQEESETSGETLKETGNIKKDIEKNNKTIQGLIRKLALMDDDLELIRMFKAEIDLIRKRNLQLEAKITSLSSEEESSSNLEFDVTNFYQSLNQFKQFSKYLSVEENRELLKLLIDHIVWDSYERTLHVNWRIENSVNSVLCIRNGCR
ncbi:MAG: recombinase family protein [Clostridiaceae bacterium]